MKQIGNFHFQCSQSRASNTDLELQTRSEETAVFPKGPWAEGLSPTLEQSCAQQ